MAWFLHFSHTIAPRRFDGSLHAISFSDRRAPIWWIERSSTAASGDGPDVLTFIWIYTLLSLSWPEAHFFYLTTPPLSLSTWCDRAWLITTSHYSVCRHTLLCVYNNTKRQGTIESCSARLITLDIDWAALCRREALCNYSAFDFAKICELSALRKQTVETDELIGYIWSVQLKKCRCKVNGSRKATRGIRLCESGLSETDPINLLLSALTLFLFYFKIFGECTERNMTFCVYFSVWTKFW